MYFTGFADEAAKGIDGQIAATLELGWKYIESRNIDGKNIHDISDEEFDIVCGKLEDAGVGINCFGSAIANWGKKIDEPFDSSIAEAKRAIPRMQRLGAKLVRIMSFAVLEDREPDDQMEQERFRRVRELVKMFADAGITAVHENCMNYGGMSWQHTLKLIENVPRLRLVYDTGNPVFTLDRSKDKPYPRQSSWEFYKNVREFISYVHVKDGKWDSENNSTIFTYPGEGDGDVVRILKDLSATGYDGGISIEPHLAVVHHDKSVTSDEQIMYSNYIEYGKRVMEIMNN
ncbi:MAG: sugar phosphate isomerase/epimerase family protein [Sedimentisphaeraceae bacterium JB056]